VGVVKLAALDVPLPALWVLSLPAPVNILGMRREEGRWQEQEQIAQNSLRSDFGALLTDIASFPLHPFHNLPPPNFFFYSSDYK